MISNDVFKVRQQRVILCNQIAWHEVEKVVLSNLGFLASSLVSFLMSENCLFTLSGL